MITIERCGEDDVEDLMGFIDTHWKRGHILGQNRALLDWQHKCDDGTYNYLLARRDGDLLGVLGYIPTTRYDAAIGAEKIVWLALWKIWEDSGVTGLGLRMLYALYRLEPAVGYAVNGINFTHPPMYRSLGYRAGELEQYFVVNPRAESKIITSEAFDVPLPHPRRGSAVFLDMTAADLAAMSPVPFGEPSVPAKGPRHFSERFLAHPFYSYRVLQIAVEGRARGLMAIRVCEHDGTKVVRIVDFAGDESALAECGTAVDRLLEETGAEYADFWQFGLSPNCLRSAGFDLAGPQGPVVPTYFEPFLSARGRIVFAIKSGQDANVRIFRADGDQDRPNFVQAL